MGKWIIEPQHELLKNEKILFEGENNGGLWSDRSHSTVNFLWNENNVYVMDNHLAAGWCWLQICSSNEAYNFLHIDQHSDDVDLVPDKYNIDLLRNTLLNTSIEEYSNIHIEDFQIFNCDSYIRPIARAFPKWFEECKFAISCQHKIFLDNYNGPHDYLNKPAFIYAQEVLELLKDLKTDKRWIVNIDLDYLYNGEDEILERSFFTELGKCIENVRDRIKVLTIAFSPTWCKDLSDSLGATDKPCGEGVRMLTQNCC